jgi:Family of unknown function (DUF5686)/CarboxypepD_reg-like domain
MRIFLFSIVLLFAQQSTAQKIYGTVFTTKGDLLPYSSITIKGSTKGASANEKAKFSINVPEGDYTVVCQHLGYATIEKKVKVSGNTEITFTMEDQKLNLETVIISSNREDPAYEVIRNAIKKREFYRKQGDVFTCNLYTKDLIKLKALPKKVFGKKIEDTDRKDMGVDSAGRGIVYLSESISKISTAGAGKTKLEIMSSRVSGSNGFGFTFPSFISLYNSNVRVFSEKFNPRGFISPIADGAISFYKFKMLGTFNENGKLYNTIKVTPRRLYEPLFTGVINIEEDSWAIHSFDLFLTKTAQLEIMDTLQLTQLYQTLDNDIRRVKNQLIHFDFGVFGIKSGGNFLTVYSDYNMNPNFPKKFFDNILIKYDTAVNKKTVAYWDSARAVPLEKEEVLDYKKKDSAFKTYLDSSSSKHYRDSLNKLYGKVKITDIITKGITKRYASKGYNTNLSLEPFLNPLNPNVEYNPAEGVVAILKGSITRSKFTKNFFDGGSSISFSPELRYGFGNGHFNPSATINFNLRVGDTISKKIKRLRFSLSGGKRVSLFNKDAMHPKITSSLSAYFRGLNYIKTYENYFAALRYGNSYESGLRFSTGLLFEDRIPLDNYTNKTYKDKYNSKITANYPTELFSTQFAAHQALLFNVSFSYKPGGKFIQYPNYKVNIGSKYPTFTLDYTKGINKIFGSDVDFDKWKVTVFDEVNLKIAGSIKYKFGVGGFLNNKQVFIQDFQHFNGNQIISASQYVNSFQLAPYYANSTTASFYLLGHVEHHFNGLLTNKIPLFRKLNWNLVAGSNAFYVDKTNHYVEIFTGIENIFKIFRVDAIVGYDKNNNVQTGIRIGAGGLLGGSISSQGGNSVSVSL